MSLRITTCRGGLFVPFMAKIRVFGQDDSASLHTLDIAHSRLHAVSACNQPSICALRFNAVAPLTLPAMEGTDTNHSSKVAASLSMNYALVQADTP
jgi:hypothetical protein